MHFALFAAGGWIAPYHVDVEQLREFVDERLKASLEGRCVYCGGDFGDRRGRTRDHIPSKALLREPYPSNLPTVDACLECNNGFSGDEQYVIALVACVLAGSTRPGSIADAKVAAMLERNSRLRSRIEQARREPLSPGGPPMWATEPDRVARVLGKNARGHLWFECADARLGEPEIWFAALESLSDEQRNSFFAGSSDRVLPEIGSRGFVRAFTTQDVVSDWVSVQEGTYRYSVEAQRDGDSRVRIVIAEYLAAEVVWGSE